MIDQNIEIHFLSNQIVHAISSELNRIGIYYRIFSRIKSVNSANIKYEEKGYKYSNKKIQDIIGIRITSYFSDDIPLIINILDRLFKLDNKEIDALDTDTFKPQRINLVYRLDENSSVELRHAINGLIENVDSTFEVQLRTVLSEGWHEVEHDLRYKCKHSWDNHKDLSRALNGIYATLETCEWSMLNLFDELAYRAYKGNEIINMIRNKLRLKIIFDLPDPKLLELLRVKISKELFRVNRNELLFRLANSKLRVPLTFNNVIFIVNHLFWKNPEINVLQNDFISTEISEYLN